MEENTFVTLRSSKPSVPFREESPVRVWLVKPPYFTPWTPPLGIAILKAFLERHGFPVTCYDYNTDPELWGMHHKYFTVLQAHEDVSINDGYSKLWAILNSHMLAYLNGAGGDTCARVVEKILPLYGIGYAEDTIRELVPLVDRYFERLDELTDAIDFSTYSVVGTSTYTTSLSSSLFILRKVKQLYPHIKTVMGGGVFADDLALGSDNLNTLVERYDYVDHVVLGEGELLFLKLLEGEISDKRVVSIADLAGDTVSMSEVPSPDFSDFDPEKYYHLTIEGARSCPFQCSFCSETVQWGDYRKKPMDLFSQQVIDLAERFNNNSFFMGDSLMNPYIMELSKELLGNNANVVYDGYLRADKPVMNRERVKLWARSGLFRVRLGIESASARVLSSMDKMTTPQTISEVLKSLAAAGVRTTTYWIVGFPDETEADFQETLDFIRDHYRFIYELEAHPYYYYPYGQIGSRLYESYSIFPDEVTEIIKFKSWDIPGVSPGREERFDRLRRISKLSSDLGIPNIYTMEERYKAEDRWRLLHPLAIEVYEGPDKSRRPARPSAEQLAGFSESREPARQMEAGAGSALCYQMTVRKRIDPELLSTALTQLIRYNETLQFRLKDGKYISEDAPAENEGAYCSSVYHLGPDEAQDPGSFKERVLAAESARLRPERGASIRVALLNTEETQCTLMLMAHRTIADARTVVLLCEDLFRIYEQISNNKQIALVEAETSYGEFLRHITRDSKASERKSAHGDFKHESAQPGFTDIILDKNLSKRIFAGELEQHGLSLPELFVIASIRSVAKVDEIKSLRFHVAQDYRDLNHSLTRTSGPLTRIIPLPSDCAKDDNPVSNLQKVRLALREPVRPATATGPAAADSRQPGDLAILINLEFLGEEPWLGGDSWSPQGFLISKGGPRPSYLLEIAPVVSSGDVRVLVKYVATAGVGKLVEGVVNHPLFSFKSSMRIILNYLKSGASF